MADAAIKIYSGREEYNNGSVTHIPKSNLINGVATDIDDAIVKHREIDHGFKAAHFASVYETKFDDY